MTDIEKRALALWGPGIAAEVNLHNFAILGSAFIEMRDRHEAFKQEVSDALVWYFGSKEGCVSDALRDFIIPKPKPDPLVDAMAELAYIEPKLSADKLRAALEARGLEIRSKNDD
jgi:hypothetical protein